MIPILAGIARLASGAAGRFAASSGGRAVASVARQARPTGRVSSGPPSAARATARAGRTGASKMTPERHSALDRLWTLDAAGNLFARLNGLAGENCSTFVHTISVTAVGGPLADLRRTWYLACAAAFGRYRNRVRNAGSSANIEATWDVTGKAVMITIGYATSGLSGQLGSLRSHAVSNPAGQAAAWITKKIVGGGVNFGGTIGPAGPPPRTAARELLNEVQFLQVGPDQVTIGKGWPDFLLGEYGSPSPVPTNGSDVWEDCASADKGQIEKMREYPRVDVVSEVPTSSGGVVSIPWGRVVPPNIAGQDTLALRSTDIKGLNAISATLPDDGRMITTGEKRDPRVQPPKPAVDGKSRMSLVQAIHAALHDPCYAPEALPCQASPLYSGGLEVYPPGRNLEDKPGDTSFSQALADVRKGPVVPSPNQTEPRLVE